MMNPIEFKEFLSNTGLTTDSFHFKEIVDVKQAVSLRDIKRVIVLQPMSKEYLGKLLFNVNLSGSPKIRVYDDCSISLVRFDPVQLRTGQKFIYRHKYVSILENFSNIFSGFFITSGISKLTPFIVWGYDEKEVLSMAHYVPPIVERHHNELILMDGIHRNFIINRCGTTIECIYIEGVRVPFSCLTRPWEEISVIDYKPENKEDRYFNLKPELFRNLEFVGIDG